MSSESLIMLASSTSRHTTLLTTLSELVATASRAARLLDAWLITHARSLPEVSREEVLSTRRANSQARASLEQYLFEHGCTRATGHTELDGFTKRAPLRDLHDVYRGARRCRHKLADAKQLAYNYRNLRCAALLDDQDRALRAHLSLLETYYQVALRRRRALLLAPAA